jgi:alpha-tubulin suppressor-like RCC1 family protein
MKAFRASFISAVLIAQTIIVGPAFAVDSSPVGRPISPYQTAAGANLISIAWSVPIQNAEAVDGYEIQYREIDSVEWVTFANKATGTSLDITGLASPGTYAVRIAAVNGSYTSPYVSVKKSVDQKVATQISTGGYSACAVLDDATAECWGYNFEGSLGDNVHTTTAHTDVPYPVKPFNLSNVVEIQSGSTNNCALKANGTVWCWGTNIFGELGDGTHYYSKKPAQVPGITDAVDIDVTYSTACAVLSNGSVKCWGLNLGRIFGDSSENNLSPRTIPGFSDVSKFMIGRTFSCALLTNKDLKCSGDNSIGQLGVGYISPENSSYIDAIIASDVKEISIGGTNACYLNNENDYYCWGSNQYGQVGDDSGRPVLSPKLVLSDVKTVSENIGYHQCVAMLDKTVNCWGWNPHDALGVNDSIEHDAPVQSTEIPSSQLSQIQSGYLFNCALSEDSGLVSCWGSNDHGQLGNGSKTNSGNFAPVNGYEDQFLLTADRPDDIDWIAQSGKSRDSINIGWHAPADNHAPIFRYNIRYTFDDIQKVAEDQVTWVEATSDIPQFIIPNVAQARAAYITVNAENAVGANNWTEPIVVTTSGTREITGVITAWDGYPVYGGSISWSTQDGSFASSKPIGLTAYGTIKFPRIPAGNLRMVFSGIHTPDGGLASGHSDIYIGFNQTSISLPRPANGPLWAIQVSAPDGAVPNAQVSVTGLSSQSRSGGFVFEVPEIMNNGLTNSDGVYLAYGYADSAPHVHVRYDDGVLVQQKDAIMYSNFTTVELEEMPWINVYQDMVDAYKDQLVSLTFNIDEAAPLSIRHNVAPLTSAGILIKVQPPKGANQNKCGAKLSGRTNANGEITLKVCATKSGKYKVLGAGAIASESVTINVAGSTPLAVKNLQAISPELETAEITWDKPSYLGGKKLKYYQITLKGNGKTKFYETKKLNYTITGLANATTYQVTVNAVTSVGNGNLAKTTVPIA